MEETTYSSADAGQCRACCGRVLSISGVRPRRAVGGAGRAEISLGRLTKYVRIKPPSPNEFRCSPVLLAELTPEQGACSEPWPHLCSPLLASGSLF